MLQFFFISSPYLHVLLYYTYYLVQENKVLGSKFCSLCELLSFTIHFALRATGLQTVSLQSRGMIFLINPSSMAVKYIFMMLFAIFALFWLFVTKNAKNMNIIFGLPTLKYTFEHSCIFIIWKTLRSHGFGHVTWKLWVGLPGAPLFSQGYSFMFI